MKSSDPKAGDTRAKAMVAARVRGYFEEEAKKRQGERTDLVKKSSQCSGKSRDLAGASVGVGGQVVDQATRILREGDPDLVAASDAGLIPANTGVKPTMRPADPCSPPPGSRPGPTVPLSAPIQPPLAAKSSGKQGDRIALIVRCDTERAV